jgi:hypothetical protein
MNHILQSQKQTEENPDPGLVAEVRIGSDPDVARDGVDSHEIDAENIGGQLIGVLRDHFDRLIAVLHIDLHGVGGRDYVD